MGQVSGTTLIHDQKQAGLKETKSGEGTLKTEGKEHTLIPLSETESASEGAFEFLQQANQKKEELPSLSQHSITYFPPEEIELQASIKGLQQELDPPGTPENKGQRSAEKSTDRQSGKIDPPRLPPKKGGEEAAPKKVYSSLFSLAQSVNKTHSDNKREAERALAPPSRETDNKKENTSRPLLKTPQLDQGTLNKKEEAPQRDREKEREGGGKQQHEREKEDQQKNKRQKNLKIGPLKGKVTTPTNNRASATAKGGAVLKDVGNIYNRFMALMARILGQAEAEAHDLYLRIKERTDNIDTLTLLLQKINATDGAIDWSNNEEMKQLVEKARQIGVNIPPDKVKWTLEEKKMLKENIHMRKDSMEKVTQLERTDMQRYLQEASQCHQARSNILKLMKEVMDTIIHNMRP